MSNVRTNDSTGIQLEHVSPILRVEDMAVSRAFYTEVLEFEEADWGNDYFTMMVRDGLSLFLCRGEQGQHGTWAWIGFEGNIHAWHRQCVERGATIRREPTNYYWAYEFQVEDPDGHVLRIGTEPDTSQPFADPDTSR
jgi:catechol 2,3-dioxygenase-like lactoylglutathione lyase family enzyme